MPGFLTDRKYKIISVCCFKATKFGVVCYAVAITNWKVTVSWSLVTYPVQAQSIKEEINMHMKGG